MSNQTVTQAIVVPGTVPNFHQGSMQLALYNPDGTPFVAGGEIMSAIPMNDSTASTIEELVSDFNVLLANLRDAGLLTMSIAN